MTRVVLTGGALTLVVTALLVAGLGWGALLPAALMGALATAIEVVALRALRRGLRAQQTTELFKGFGVGMLLRLAGAGVFTALVLWDRERFLPLAAGLGYVGVLIPLLFLEARFIR